MPSLPDAMYCSEQICIPPAFPYLLRQFAKAAVRTQPTDLLKWSTAYFRCLSLNIPPPVKPRLEYPVPRDYFGITPGWLKALLNQLQNNLTISFKVLWDRWVGACLHHNTLIKLLCLGGFDNPNDIPWLRFVAICAGTLSDDLTHTMILVCEILTEEPEGGSSMITLETFLDLYQFLAKIDASKDQMLKNYFFRDSLLSLWREKVEKLEDHEEEHEIVALESEPSEEKISSESLEETDRKEDVERAVSCPSLPEDDHYSYDFILKDEVGDGVEEHEEGVILDDILIAHIEAEEGEQDEASMKEDAEEGYVGETTLDEQNEEHKEDEEEKELTNEDLDQDNEEEKEEEKEQKEEKEEKEETLKTDATADEAGTEPTENEDELKEYESAETIVGEPTRNLDFDDDETLRQDLERLRALQQELAGETDEELEKFKCRLIEEMPLTESQQEGIKHFQIGKPAGEPSSSEEKVAVDGKAKEDIKEGDVSSESQEKDEKQYEDVFVEAIPGIGGIVPDEIINDVIDYMKGCAKNQHGMVMPRNIRHYSCPPLEILNY